MKPAKIFSKLLQKIHHENTTINTLDEFREKYPTVSWTEIIYLETGDSILHIAAQLGKYDFVKYIIQNWPPKNIDIKNNDCKTPLHEAAQFSQPKLIKLLLENGAQIDAIKRADWTPLMLACTKSGQESYETVSLLIENGANIQLRNKDGWTALHLACRTGDINITKLLFTHSDANLINMRTNNGRTILHIACLHANANIVEILLKSYDFDVNNPDNCGNSSFHDAVCSDNIETVNILLKYGVNVNINMQNKAGLTVVHLAAAEGLENMLKYLFALGINKNILTSTNMTALHHAARKKQLDMINFLINVGVDPSIVDTHGRTYQDYLKL